MDNKPNWLIYALILISMPSFVGCNKNNSSSNLSTQELFYISFSTPDSNYTYQVGDQYQYLRGGSQGATYTNTGLDFFISPSTYITPDLSAQTVGLQFSIDELFGDYTIHWVALGDTLFRQGARMYCGNGFLCSNGNSVNVFWTFGTSSMQSMYSLQPGDSYFIIDSVLDSHHVENLNLKDYDKIISGRFQCKVFNPTDTTQSKNLTNGKFRMPVWRNQQDGL